MRKISLIFIMILFLICGMNIKVKAEEEINLNKYLDSIRESKKIDEPSKGNKEETKQQNQNVSDSEKEEKTFNSSNIGFKWFGGLTYNTFDTTMILHGLKWAKHKEKLQNGEGFYGGIKYKFSERVGIKGGIEYISTAEIDNLEVSLFAPYGEVTLGFFDDLIELNAGLGKYSYEFMKIYYSYDYLSADYSERNATQINGGEGIGYLLGSQINIPFNQDSYVKIGAKYRFLDVEIDQIEFEDAYGLEIDMSGWRFNLGICQYF